MKPNSPQNLNDVSSWSAEQMAYAAPLILAKANQAIEKLDAEIKSFSQSCLEVAVQLASIKAKYIKHASFWSDIKDGKKVKIPAFLREVKVASYNQMNNRIRRNKVLHSSPKDWGIWSN